MEANHNSRQQITIALARSVSFGRRRTRPFSYPQAESIGAAGTLGGIENILSLLEYNNEVFEKADQLSRRARDCVTNQDLATSEICDGTVADHACYGRYGGFFCECLIEALTTLRRCVWPQLHLAEDALTLHPLLQRL